MSWELFNFTDDYQEAIIACLLRRPQDFMAYGWIVKPEYFHGRSTFLLVTHLQEYLETYGRFPQNFTILANYAHDMVVRKSPEEAEEILNLCARLATTNTEDWKSVRDRCLHFAKERAALNAVKKIHFHITEGKTSEIDPVKELQAALAVGMNYDDLGVNLVDDYEKVIRMIHGDAGFGIPTGYTLLDQVWKTGWHPGWLIAILAPPKRYKTTFCLNSALGMAQRQANGGDVLYYACEISQELAAMRAIYNLSEQTEENIMEDGISRFIQITGKKIKKKMGHHVWFKGFGSKQATIGDIRNHARFVTEQCGIENLRAIFIDYAETVRPMRREKNEPEYRASAQVYTEARALGMEMGCPVIMPDRCNKETVGRKVPDMSGFQGSFEKAGIVDAAIGLCATNAEHVQNKIRYFIFLNRHGPQYLHYEGKVDPKRYTMTIDKELEYDPALEDEEERPRNRKRKPDAASSIGHLAHEGGADVTQSDA